MVKVGTAVEVAETKVAARAGADELALPVVSREVAARQRRGYLEMERPPK